AGPRPAERGAVGEPLHLGRRGRERRAVLFRLAGPDEAVRRRHRDDGRRRRAVRARLHAVRHDRPDERVERDPHAADLRAAAGRRHRVRGVPVLRPRHGHGRRGRGQRVAHRRGRRSAESAAVGDSSMSTPIVRSAPGKRRTERLLSFVLACAVCAASIAASARAARATPPYEIPEPWTYRALDKLAADGVLGDPRRTTALDLRPRTRQQAARLVARAVRRLQDRGIADASQDDLDTLGRLVHAYSYELALLGIRVDSVEDAVRPPDASEPVRAFHVEGAFAAEGAFRQRDTVPHNVQGGPIDPFVDAFLTSPPDDNPFEHDPGPGTLLRFDAKLSPTYTMNGNVSISVPIHVLEYDPAFTANDSYQVQPALVVNAARFGALRDVRFRAGTLDDLESSRLGLTYRAPDATQQGPG